MCYYNSLRLQPGSIIKLGEKELQFGSIKINRVQRGADYQNWPVILPTANGIGSEIKSIHWEYIPAIVHDEHELFEARIMNHWLNVKAENLLKNDRGKTSLFREGALYGRCLVLSSGFYEYRAVPKTGKRGQPLKQTERIPYYITLKEQPVYFFMAGISRTWTNETRQQSADTFAIVTTVANEFMQTINNTKLRMPVILNEEAALHWLKRDLSEKEIMEAATFQYPDEQMIAWPVAKDFLQKENPEEPFSYNNLSLL